MIVLTAPAGARAGARAAARDYPEVAEQLRVPPGNRRVATLWASGVRLYRFSAGEWAFVEVAAVLTKHGSPVALYQEALNSLLCTSIKDGSSVGGRQVAEAPHTGSVPELLLAATTNQGPGLFAEVSYIQRLNPLGGLPPSYPATEGTRAAIPYSATYTFHAPT